MLFVPIFQYNKRRGGDVLLNLTCYSVYGIVSYSITVLIIKKSIKTLMADNFTIEYDECISVASVYYRMYNVELAGVDLDTIWGLFRTLS